MRSCILCVHIETSFLWAEFVNKNRCISVLLVSEEVKSKNFIIEIIHIIVSYDQNISLIFLCDKWIQCQTVPSVLCIHYRPETVHCSTKDAYTSEITFFALHLWATLFFIQIYAINMVQQFNKFQIEMQSNFPCIPLNKYLNQTFYLQYRHSTWSEKKTFFKSLSDLWKMESHIFNSKAVLRMSVLKIFKFCKSIFDFLLDNVKIYVYKH